MLKLYESLANEVFLMWTSATKLIVTNTESVYIFMYVWGSIPSRVTLRAISLQFTTFHLNSAKLCRSEVVHVAT